MFRLIHKQKQTSYLAGMKAGVQSAVAAAVAAGLMLGFLMVTPAGAQAQWGEGNSKNLPSAAQKQVPLQHGAHRIGKRTDADMNRWRDYGLGEFIHMGLYSILGGDYNSMHYDGAAEWIRSWNKLPHEVYDNLYKKFDPKNFDPEVWARMAKNMGVRYVTITTKHHDGFCLWPSKYTDFNITKTPYKKDMIGPLVKAFDQAGIDVYLYFSVMDWHQADWRYDLKTVADSVAFNRFKTFTKNQLTELLTLYPQTKGLWFDGTWDNSWKKSGAFSDSLDQYLKKIHPGLIIGSRLRADDYGNRHFDANGHLMGDYEQGWERKIPSDYTATRGNDWDCIMTIPQNGWGYSKTWMGHWKTPYELIEMLAKCVSLDGNFVVNFGPKGDGTFRKKELQTADSIGAWMKVNHEAIYNAGYLNWTKQDWGYYTRSRKDGKIYMIVFNVPINGALKVSPAKKEHIKKAYLLQDNKTLHVEALDGNDVFIQLEQKNQQEPFVIVLETGQGGQAVEGENKHV
ncbi:alpha-L-fucosidase [Arachidicoccus rhizosphaerae]|uniref:alpha-L-fucosidase n=1 Tax=Arachidicoccus rhizosphaerae TaxID=551991 RepID=A0A1H3Z0L2_9BACT|nr:alpha-L-fucosidase [Arachidicoccus rhizosphaerae]SEA16968.1 alpha-L-fucosidase [Arachidicoccus rhizosphaerae]